MPHEDSRGWVSRWWRALLAEVVATALLMALGLGSVLPSGVEHDLTHPAWAFGGAVTALVTAFGATSGAHMNPAVTLAALVHKQIAPLPALAYVIAQLVGATCGFGVLMALDPMVSCHCVTEPRAGLGGGGAALVEALLTGTLALVAGGLWAAHDPARPDHTAPLKLGITIAGLVYTGGKLTNASLNPARSLGPALLLGCWRAHWAYWLGPLGGALVASLLHRHVLLPRAPSPARAPPASAPETLPLHDKPDH